MESGRNLKVDAYIAKAKPFAQPVLVHLRELVHRACPGVVEEIKWSRPFFIYEGAILGNMSAFKEHCSFGFWGEEIADVLRKAEALRPGAMGSLGRIGSLADLPADKLMLDWLRHAARLIASGHYTGPMASRNKVVKAPKVDFETPPEFSAALANNKAAEKAYAAFSPSCKREYLEWFAEAKRPETREKRIATAVEWIAEGKQRHWKYQAG